MVNYDLTNNNLIAFVLGKRDISELKMGFFTGI